MRAERSQNREAVKGGLALGGLMLAFLFIFFLADVRQFFTPSDDLYVLMPTAAGLQPGSLVWVAGQTVGEVKEIEVRPPGADSLHRVLVRIEIASKHREHIRRDSEVRITSFSLIGDPVLDIAPGSPSAPVIEPNDTLPFRVTGSPAAAIERARSLNASMQDLVAQTKVVAMRAADRAPHAQRLITALERAGRELEAFTTAMEEGPLNTLSDPEFNRTINSLFATVSELRDSFARATERARAARSEAEPSLRRLTARADTISQAVRQLQDAIARSGGGLLTRALTDSAIVKALHGAQTQLDSLIVETKREPWRFWLGN